MEEFPTMAHHIHVEEQQQQATSSSNGQQQSIDPCAQLVHVLMCYQVGGGDPDFIRKAIESLVKKLKDRRDQLDALIMAVTSGGKQPTSCVTIPRSLDGRLQVAGRKGLPHVVYARIWRWPNVNKTELLKLPMCITPADHPDLICINPFHYDRIVSSGLANIDLASFRMDPLSSTPDQLPPPPPQNFLQINPELASSSSTDPFGPSPPSSYPISLHQHSFPMENTPSVSDHHNPCIPSPPDRPSRVIVHYPQNNWLQLAPSEFHQHQQLCSTSADPFPRQRYNLDLVQLPPLQTHPEHWCSINYFELDSQLGERFKTPWTMAEVIVDGGMDPAGAMTGRFCLGALPNVHRSEASERARLHIGKGIRLKCTADGSVYLECLSQKGVFVRSYYLEFESGLQYGSSVHKICSGVERKVFDLRWAYSEMCGQRESAQLAAVAQAYAVAGLAPQLAPSLGERAVVTGVDDLRRICCTIALSFVKGWGAGYARGSIKETPCWIEIQFHRPLQLLNELLQRNE